MIPKAMPYLLALSLALNVPFVGMWAYHTFRDDHWGPPGPPPHEVPGGPGWPRDGKQGQRFGPDPKFMMRRIGVTEDQWQKMKERQLTFHKRMDASLKQASELERKLIELLSAPDEDEKRTRETFEALNQNFRERLELMLSQIRADKKDLTPEQMTRLVQFLRRIHSIGMGPGGGRGFHVDRPPGEPPGPEGPGPQWEGRPKRTKHEFGPRGFPPPPPPEDDGPFPPPQDAPGKAGRPRPPLED